LKKYGALVADNGGFFSISVAPDDRWPVGAFDHLSSISVTNFEVIQTTGPTQGPRSPGAPIVNAGADQFVSLGQSAQLRGAVLYTNTAPLATLWRLYAGPGTVAFNDANQTNSTATFSAAGVYTLLLSASNGVHTTAFDAVIVTVQDTLRLTITRSGSNVVLGWTGGRSPYTVQACPDLAVGQWSSVLTTNGTNARVSTPPTARFFRVQSN